jgi:hypothetical protein
MLSFAPRSAFILPRSYFYLGTRVQYSTVAAEERDGANRARWQSHGAVKPHFVPPQRCGKDGRARKSPPSAGRFGMQSVERGLVPIHRLIQRRRSHLLSLRRLCAALWLPILGTTQYVRAGLLLPDYLVPPLAIEKALRTRQYMEVL